MIFFNTPAIFVIPGLTLNPGGVGNNDTRDTV